MSQPEDELWRLLAVLGSPMRQFMSQSSGSAIHHEVHWKCGCRAAGESERMTWNRCDEHVTSSKHAR